MIRMSTSLWDQKFEEAHAAQYDKYRHTLEDWWDQVKLDSPTIIQIWGWPFNLTALLIVGKNLSV